jgi:hypothetical protein
MFQQPAPNSPPSSAAPAAPAANARINEAGEFTRMFQQPTVNTPPPANPQRPQAPGDDFTKFFGNQMPSTPLAENLDRPSVIPPGPPPEAGSFTRILGAMDTAPPTRAPASGATAIFSSPAPPASAPAPSAAGPGEYTRLFPAPAATPPESPASPAAGATTSPAPASKSEAKAPASPSAVAKTGDYTALIIILAVLALIAIGLILYFLLRK